MQRPTSASDSLVEALNPETRTAWVRFVQTTDLRDHVWLILAHFIFFPASCSQIDGSTLANPDVVRGRCDCATTGHPLTLVVCRVSLTLTRKLASAATRCIDPRDTCRLPTECSACCCPRHRCRRRPKTAARDWSLGLVAWRPHCGPVASNSYDALQ